ncbi:helix-turn-helix domain protein [Methanoregula boonei 6A8]|uniref:Helix-turn-helix domain protein n=1 Tax=Methanoregula boonei (strain DSM 21154 / JCM 14090 / 6A8) TaxID=456442 RepID=A7I8B9_METB6|nr:multiprotein bridging factor aMBF1 [Methanoregula boonei]ABS55980.1 helix-turn-helix domain protein [Methanoregula boonei 6A8]
MQCEMCGETIRGAPKLIRVEGAELQVCAKCGKFGTEVQQPRRTDMLRPGAPRPAPGSRAPASSAPAQRKRDMFDYMEGEIVEDYAERVRNARMEKGISQKDLALQLMVRELLIKKIEKGELIPEEEVRKKLEKVLGIKLVDIVAGDDEKKAQAKITQTLGDLTIIRKAKK